MKKIIITLMAFLFLTSCGYTPVYLNQNFDFKIKGINNSKENQLNSKINRNLISFSNHESQNMITLELDAQKKTNVLAKDSRGDPSRYEMIVNIKLEIKYGKDQNISQSFEERFNYNTNSNKFKLRQYEKEIEDMLINKNINRITIYLSKI
jgi:hypothetical protein|tara:strand:- start:689 stop:1141 length:453 start_codon:yes stop_codon:yes gene_type:complete